MRAAVPVRGALRVGPGAATPLGAHPVPGGIRFAVSAPRAEAVHLLLTVGDAEWEIPFPRAHRTGAVFTMTVHGLEPGPVRYAYRVFGAGEEEGKTVPVDPYARRLVGAEHWGRRPEYRSALPSAASGDFAWGEDRRPGIAPQDLVVYEVHVRGFTRHPSARVPAPGTYAALREKIPYLRELGINCVELLPVFEFDETDNTFHAPDTGAPLRNYWGYNPVSFFAPKAGYAAEPAEAARELKELVRELHRAGIEIILDVVFNHTGEGGPAGPALGFRGLDEDAFYLRAADGSYLNLTATGNTVNGAHPRTGSLILESLRYWAHEFHVDGFRFDMAPILARGREGALQDRPYLLEAIAEDPVLADCKLIAEATDATGADLVGAFPAFGRWMEWNGRFRDTVRRFLTGRPGTAADLALRLTGSPDLFPDRGPAASVNYVTCHDGFTLADWSAYDRPHNEANGEGGADGIADNDSWNCGAEGPSADPVVRRLRRRQARNAFLLLLLSQGVPMFPAGDEFGRTQRGNNNAYSQDTAWNWVDWGLREREADLFTFVRRCLAFRRAHPLLRRARFPADGTPAGWVHPPVSWHGRRPWEPDWSAHSLLLCALLYERTARGEDDAVFLAANSHDHPMTVEPPPAPAGTRWHVFADSAADGVGAHPPGEEEPLEPAGPLSVAEHSLVVLTALPTGRNN
ncbi:glycogen-debranching protein [Streptomyces albofaciens JCM 4342]|uniref:glycogen debranching protein n=1 Tax=Streptomyces albofaciens TaxID=66866 RepID=UPI00123BC27E|nr:isoamylase [Streptomyces albofaciens]KAA6212710.1 glycogen-debranching protein [Streptomyces albofaciens JCM 4342]